MTYCSLEEAWGIDFKNNIENNIENNENTNIPSYGTNLNINNDLKTNSNNVPYQIRLPDNSRRNSIGDLNDNSIHSEENTDLENFLNKTANIIAIIVNR